MLKFIGIGFKIVFFELLHPVISNYPEMKKGFKPHSREGNCDHGLFETFLLRIESDNPSRTVQKFDLVEIA